MLVSFGLDWDRDELHGGIQRVKQGSHSFMDTRFKDFFKAPFISSTYQIHNRAYVVSRKTSYST